MLTPMVLSPWSKERFVQLDQNFPSPRTQPEGVTHLNRYGNVLPNPRTRVRLVVDSNSDDNDYINANYIHGFDGQPCEYVLKEGPAFFFI